MFGTILPPLPFPFCARFTFFSESSKFCFGVGSFASFRQVFPCPGARAVCSEQALHHPGCDGPARVRSGGTLGCCPPCQVLASEFCHWFSAGAASVPWDWVFREQRAGHERCLLCRPRAPFLLWWLDKIFYAVGVFYRRNVWVSCMNFK